MKAISKDDNLRLWFVNWLESQKYICFHCGKAKVKKSFYHTRKSKAYPTGYLPVCKKCANKLFMDYQRMYDSPYSAIERICLLFDIPYDVRMFNACIKQELTVEKWFITDRSIVGKYLQKLNLRQNKRRRSYRDSYKKPTS
jgi:hypothetical protein